MKFPQVKLPKGAKINASGFDESRTLRGPLTKPLAPQALAAIVQLDVHKLDPQAAALWGMQQMTAKYRELARHMGDASPVKEYAMACYKLGLALAEEDDRLQVELTKAATKCGAATVHHLKSDAAGK